MALRLTDPRTSSLRPTRTFTNSRYGPIKRVTSVGSCVDPNKIVALGPENSLIDADVPDLFAFSLIEAAPHRPLHDGVNLVPFQLQLPSHHFSDWPPSTIQLPAPQTWR